MCIRQSLVYFVYVCMHHNMYALDRITLTVSVLHTCLAIGVSETSIAFANVSILYICATPAIRTWMTLTLIDVYNNYIVWYARVIVMYIIRLY